MTELIQGIIGKVILSRTVLEQKEYIRLLDPFFFEKKDFIKSLVKLGSKTQIITQLELTKLGLTQEVITTCVARESMVGNLDTVREALIDYYEYQTNEMIKTSQNLQETLITIKESEDRIARLKQVDVLTLDQVFSESVEEQAKNPRDLSKLPKTGFQEMDSVFRGFLPGQLVTIGGYSGVGKSTLIFSLVRHLASFKKVLLFSLEMDSQVVYYRLLAGMSQVPFDEVLDINNPDKLQEFVRTGQINKINNAQKALHNLNLRLVDNNYSIIDITTNIRREAKNNGLDFVMIDYLQLIKAIDTRQPMRIQIAEITRELKLLASELGITIVVLAQLGRSALNRETPQIQDLKESGNIEADSDTIFLIYRDEKKQNYLRLAKDRMFGRFGTAELTYNNKTQVYE